MDRGVPFFLERALADDGSALWPERWPAERLLAKRAGMGGALFDLQYQNDPTGMGGNIFRRDWFHSVERIPEGARRVGVDLAITANERSDYTELPAADRPVLTTTAMVFVRQCVLMRPL
jgi:hypothetical protein